MPEGGIIDLEEFAEIERGGLGGLGHAFISWLKSPFDFVLCSIKWQGVKQPRLAGRNPE
jgi:hypothetical protein